MVQLLEKVRLAGHEALGMGNDNYRYHDHEKLAHYANAATDIEFKMPFGFKEVEGISQPHQLRPLTTREIQWPKHQYFDPEPTRATCPTMWRRRSA